MVLLLAEMEQYAYESLSEHESRSDEGGPDKENHIRNTEWCQFTRLTTVQEALCCLELEEMYNRL